MVKLGTATSLLEFLRNLTPQILLLSVAFVLGSKLDITKFQFTLQGVKNAWPFVSVLLVLFVAFFANMLSSSNECLKRQRRPT
jgi:hypothetical protein